MDFSRLDWGQASEGLKTQQQLALMEALVTPGPVLITGGAGTGKSFVLSRFVSAARDSGLKVVVAAPTGIAALNVEGITLHSLFGLRVHGILGPTGGFRETGSDFFKDLDVLVIDEVSMVRIDQMDTIDRAMRFHRRSDEPFGGVKLLMFGDPYQLPPVVTAEDIKYSATSQRMWFNNYKEHKHFFLASVFSKAPIRTLQLTEIVRQENDLTFAEILSRVRVGRMSRTDRRDLQENSQSNAPSDSALRIYGKNAPADAYNEARLRKLGQPIKSFEGYFSPNPDLDGKPIRTGPGIGNLPTQEILNLAEGARIIFIQNDRAKRWVNGSQGVITQISSDSVNVKIDGGLEVKVTPAEWDIRELVETADGRVYARLTGWFVQLPLRLGWAITVHKSQGLTLDAAVLDFQDQYFERGQAYVALSRVRKLENIYFITGVSDSDVLEPDVDVRNFMEKAEHFPFERQLEKEKEREVLWALVDEACAGEGITRGAFVAKLGKYASGLAGNLTSEDVLEVWVGLLESETPRDGRRAQAQIAHVAGL